MDKRVSFFDLELALTQGYVHEPHGGGFASFGDERTSCSVYYQALKERRYEAEPCAVKCALCQQVGDTTDYIRGFRQRNGKREVAKPHYPVPAIYDPDNRSHFYWRLPPYPEVNLSVLLAGWELWNHSRIR